MVSELPPTPYTAERLNAIEAVVVKDANGRILAALTRHQPEELARLWAAAPELLAALRNAYRELLRYNRDMVPPNPGVLGQISLTLVKATGKEVKP